MAYQTFIAPFSYEFMVNGFIVGIILAIPCGLLSCYLVLKGWSLMGDAISHGVLPGIVLAHILNLPLGLGAFVAGLFCAIASGYLQENCRVKQDTILGIVFSGMFAVGIVLYTAIETDIHLDHILFGNILGINRPEILTCGVIAAFISGVIITLRKDFMLYVFDPTQAHAIGLYTQGLHYGLLIMISMTVVAALNAVGIILAIAFLITPGAISYLLTRRFDHMLIVSVLIAIMSSVSSIYISFFIDSAPAPTIVLVMTVCFIIALIFSQTYTRIKSRTNTCDDE